MLAKTAGTEGERKKFKDEAVGLRDLVAIKKRKVQLAREMAEREN